VDTQDLIEIIKSISPEVWRVLMRQVWISFFQHLVWLVVFIVPVFPLMRVMRGALEEKEQEGNKTWGSSDYWKISYYLSLAGLATIGMIVLAMLATMVGMLVNPKFYAIKALIFNFWE